MLTLRALLTSLLLLTITGLFLATPADAGQNGIARQTVSVYSDGHYDDNRMVVASARHGRSHVRLYDTHRHSPPYGRAYGYYKNHDPYRSYYRHLHRHFHNRDRYDLRPYRVGERYRSHVGVNACIGGHDGFFCFNTQNWR